MHHRAIRRRLNLADCSIYTKSESIYVKESSSSQTSRLIPRLSFIQQEPLIACGCSDIPREAPNIYKNRIRVVRGQGYIDGRPSDPLVFLCVFSVLRTKSRKPNPLVVRYSSNRFCARLSSLDCLLLVLSRRDSWSSPMRRNEVKYSRFRRTPPPLSIL